MELFAKFSELTWFTVAMVGVALGAGVLALVKRNWAKPVLAAAGLIEVGLIGAYLVVFRNLQDAAGTAYEGIELSKSAYTLSVIGLVIVMLAFVFLSGRRVKWTARDIATASMVVALSFLLSFIQLGKMPQGGSITPASLLPMMVYIVAFGPARGLVVGFAYGLLQLVQDPYVIHPAQLLLDYPLAFGALALGGLVNYLPIPKRFQLPAGIAAGYIGRFAVSVLSGVIFFASYAGEKNVWIYSIVYNGSYLGVDMAICVAISLLPGITRMLDEIRPPRLDRRGPRYHDDKN